MEKHRLATTSNYLYLFLDHIPIRPIGFHPFCHTLQGLLKRYSIRVDHGAGDYCFIPFVLQVHLCHRDIELAMQARDKRLEPSALFFERGTGGEVQVDGEDSYHYGF